jgi:hypothetical protein
MSNNPVHKVFISYHHSNDEAYKLSLLTLNTQNRVFIDGSVDIGDINPYLSDHSIRVKIRDEYLRDTTVTVLLVGTETARRKHIDWELYSSMIDGPINKRSGIVVVQLPSTHPDYFTAPHGDVEKNHVYPDWSNWYTIDSRSEYERHYPYLPARIIDQLLSPAPVSVTQWSRLGSKLENLALLIECAYQARTSCNYDLSRPMKKNDS